MTGARTGDDIFRGLTGGEDSRGGLTGAGNTFRQTVAGKRRGGGGWCRVWDRETGIVVNTFRRTRSGESGRTGAGHSGRGLTGAGGHSGRQTGQVGPHRYNTVHVTT